MADAKVVFFTMLPEELAKLIAEYTPPGFTTEICRGQLSDEEKIEKLKDADFILAYGGSFSERVLRSAPKVRLVQLLSAGYDRMDLKLLKELEIPCANNGGANSWAVADHAVLLMLGLYKKLVLSDTGVRENRWRGVIDGFNTYEMANKLVGIIGMGNIGRKVVKRVQGFECRVQYYDKYPMSQEQEKELGVQRVSLEELMSTSDIVTMHTPLTPETRHMVGREQLALMKPSAIIINTSRGPVIDP